MASPQVKISPSLPGKLPGKLPGVPSKALDPQQQLEALRRAQSQAEQRVKLGVQLFKAAEARTAQQRDEIQQLRREQDQLREQLQQDIARSFQSYDQWIAKVDDTLTNSLKSIEDRIEQLQSRWHQTERQIETMIHRSQTLLSQSVEMMRGHQTHSAPLAPQSPPQQVPYLAHVPRPEQMPQPEPQPEQPLSHAPHEEDVDEQESRPVNPIYTQVLRRLNTDRNDDDGPRAA